LGNQSKKTCWILTEGFAGMKSQCIGLAKALGVDYKIKNVKRPSFPLYLFSPALWKFMPWKVKYGNELDEPLPDMTISCGRVSIGAVIQLKQKSRGKLFSVHIQKPYLNTRLFDCIIIPSHDHFRSSNVFVAETSMHEVTKDSLVNRLKENGSHFSHLRGKIVLVLLGGNAKKTYTTSEEIHNFGESLALLSAQYSYSFLVSPSRRTPKEQVNILKTYLRSTSHYIWDGQGENPYYAMLAAADYTIVSGDSVCMLSEATATGKPVYIWKGENIRSKYIRFHKSLEKMGVARVYSGKLENWSYPPPQETQRIAGLIKEKFSI
jgi:uncharacterized protein